MISYFIKSGICLALLLLFYHLVLEREKMHQFNRFYLLGSVLFSFLAPLFIIYIEVPIEIPIEKIKQPIVFETAETIKTSINYFNYFQYFSIFISSILLIRFIKNVVAIYQKTRKNPTIKHQKATLVLVDDKISPHTFWNYIFMNKGDYYSQKIEEELFTHELTHASQKHTFDVLLIEVLKIVFWFNPIFYFLKRTIQLNHEFLADTKVVSDHKNISEYQHLLLNKTAWNNEYYLASNLNYLLTKKRLLMMTKQSSPIKILLKKLAIIPVIVGFVFIFAQRVEAEEKSAKTLNNITANKLSLLVKKDTLPPPPPKPETGFYEKDGKKLFYVKNKKGTTYYNKYGQEVTKKGQIINTEQTKSNEVIPNQNISKVYKNGKVVVEFKKNNTLLLPPPPKANFPEVKKGEVSNIPPPAPIVKKGAISNIPPPPPPMSAKELVFKYPKATFYFNDEKTSHKKVVKLVKKEKKLNVLTQDINNKKIIKFTTQEHQQKSANTVNAKYYLDGKLISKKEAAKIDPKKIKAVDVKKNKDGTGSIYIATKK